MKGKSGERLVLPGSTDIRMLSLQHACGAYHATIVMLTHTYNAESSS